MAPHSTVHIAQQPVKMNGVFVRLSPEDFQSLLNRNEGLAVITTSTSFFGITFTYVTSYKGLVFYCKTKSQLSVPGRHETIQAQSVSLPVM
ncbi:MAG: hypothetical protein KIT62_16925 [Cyclobacteriaceae bacterium]|nr:hypothetical protein [Cyclobacteriaceae bacterium]